MRVLEVTSDSDSSVMEVVRLISTDQSLTTRILQLVNRAAFGVREEVTSVERAVVLLGFEAVRSAVLSLSVFETMDSLPVRGAQSESRGDGRSDARGSAPEAPFSREEFWKHSIAVASAAELLSEALVSAHGRDVGFSSGEAFVCGLLHDLGKVALDAVLPKSFAKVIEASDLLRGNIADLERTIIGLDHTIVGKRLAERWELPAILRESIWLHGQVPQALPRGIKCARMVNLITLADLIAREQHLGYSGNYSMDLPREELIAAIGLSPDAVETKMTPLLERIERRAAVLNLHVPSTNDLYQQAMKRANLELGKVSTQLAMKNRRLATRSRFFDALGAFQLQLRPDSNPQAVLAAIGRSAVSVLGVTALGVFSLAPGQDFAETLLIDENGEVFETTLVDCGAAGDALRSHPTGGSDGPVLPAGDELEWLVRAIDPRLSHERRFWISLSADNSCVGGIVWGAVPGESQRLSPQAQELSAMSGGWQLALRMSQIREESRHLAEQLTQTNRQLQSAQADLQRGKIMMSVGEMAAGAAHEMNNPLAVISGRSQLLASSIGDAKQAALAGIIHEQSIRLSQIITELMEFARPSPARPKVCDVAELIDRAIHQAKERGNLTDRTVELTTGQIPPVAVDADQVTDALTEVIENAWIATDGKGGGSNGKGAVEIHAAIDPVGRRVVISISDNGPGMEEAALKRAFDPFYSSKPAGRRRGMGLPKALRWLEGSGGTIKLESRPGKGTRALILLPAAEANAAATTEPSNAQPRKAVL